MTRIAITGGRDHRPIDHLDLDRLTPRFVNLGTREEPYWQRASMHCKCCGGYSSSQHCWYCSELLGREIDRLLRRQAKARGVPVYFVSESNK